MKHKTLVVVQDDNELRLQFEYFGKLLHKELIKEHVVITRDYAKLQTEDRLFVIVKVGDGNYLRGTRCHHLIYLADQNHEMYDYAKMSVRPFRD
jgi:hypothetical protein